MRFLFFVWNNYRFHILCIYTAGLFSLYTINFRYGDPMNTIIRLFIGTALVTLLTGCAYSDRYNAKVRLDGDIQQQFFEQEDIAKYNFYYYGREHKPTAILALDKNYTLQSQFWFPKEPTEQQLQDWSRIVSRSTIHPTNEYRGKEILSPKSDRIGMVISRYYWVTAWFNDPESKRITIPPPEPHDWQAIPFYKQNNYDNS